MYVDYNAQQLGDLGFHKSFTKAIRKVVAAPFKVAQAVVKPVLQKVVKPIVKAPFKIIKRNKRTLKKVARVAAAGAAAFYGAPYLLAMGSGAAGALSKVAPQLLPYLLMRQRQAAAGQVPQGYPTDQGGYFPQQPQPLSMQDLLAQSAQQYLQSRLQPAAPPQPAYAPQADYQPMQDEAQAAPAAHKAPGAALGKWLPIAAAAGVGIPLVFLAATRGRRR